MRAAVIDRYGAPDVVRVRHVERPRPESDQVLLRVRASSVNPIDAKIRDGTMRFRHRRRFPMLLGFDASGVIVEAGSDVHDFHIGDLVLARSDQPTGRACAEYLATSAATLARKPATISHREAAAMPLAGLTALQALRDDCQLRPGQHVLIVGASGGVGTYAVQVAKTLGATVTAVCGPGNLDLVDGLGADRLIDYTSEDVAGTDRRYDCIFDVVGSQRFREAARSLTPEGRYAVTVPGPDAVWSMVAGNRLRRQKARFVMCKPRGSDLHLLADWARAGQVRSVIEHVYPLDEVAQAHRRIETRRTRGKLVVDIAGDGG